METSKTYSKHRSSMVHTQYGDAVLCLSYIRKLGRAYNNSIYNILSVLDKLRVEPLRMSATHILDMIALIYTWIYVLVFVVVVIMTESICFRGYNVVDGVQT